MKIDLSNKTALVTGSTAGIGLAIAKGLAEAGASVVINGRTPAAVERSLAELRRPLPGASLRGVVETVTLADLAAGKLPARIAKLADDPEAWATR